MEILEKLSEIFVEFEKFFWGIGYFGWQIATIYAIYVSYSYSWLYVFVYTLVFALSGWINHDVLKHYIQNPRPKNSTPFLASEHFSKKTNGMPSGHAQITAYSLTFSYLLTGTRFYESLALLGLTVLQRHVYYNHTILQLAVGTLIGVLSGYAVVFALRYIENQNRKRKHQKTDKNTEEFHFA